MPNKHVYRAARGLFHKPPPNRVPLPAPNQGNSPWYFTAGPVFFPGADGAILNSKLSKPWQVIYGYGYRVANPNKFPALQPSQLFAPKGAPTVGINIQLGYEGVLTPATNGDGTFADEGIFGYGPDSGVSSSTEGEW